MIKSSIIPKTLQSFEYYVNKLPMYLQQSYGFIEHYRIWYDLLVGNLSSKVNSSGVLGSSSALFNLLNIFNQKIEYDGTIVNTYLEDLIQFEDAGIDENNKYGTKSDVLDKLGALFDVKRSFQVSFTDQDEQRTEYVNLNNEEFLILIKAQIVKNYYDGSYEQVERYYDEVGLNIAVTTSDSEVATVNVYLINSGDRVASDNINTMFLAGLLTIESMGIKYRKSIVDLNNILVWDSTDSNRLWDGGQWLV